MTKPFHTPPYHHTTPILLFQTPPHILPLLQPPVPIHTLNVAAIPFANHPKQITKSLTLTQKHIHPFHKLHELRVNLHLPQ
ncbi:PTS sugar transporter subunit IIB, partial [Priestia megaterium]|uniref:PTS sugar transporter subunit IIB n=1 Tax=Priestia megaterium TaxID=1404 RepID=UPI0037096D72